MQASPARLKALEVILQAKELPIPHGNHVVGCIAAQKPHVDNWNAGFGQSHVITVDPGTAALEPLALLHHFRPDSPLHNVPGSGPEERSSKLSAALPRTRTWSAYEAVFIVLTRARQRGIPARVQVARQ